MKQKLFLISFALFMATVYTGCKKDEPIALAGITLSKTSTSLKPETTEALSVAFFPENAASKELVWSTSKPEVATVDNAGKITAVGVGTATISAVHTLNSAIKATCDVAVSWATLNNTSGNVSGVWEKNSTVNVSGHITVPAGQTLTIEEGVQVIFDDN